MPPSRNSTPGPAGAGTAATTPDVGCARALEKFNAPAPASASNPAANLQRLFTTRPASP